MPDWELVSRSHVLAAMQEYDSLGDREFLRRYGFGRAKAYTVWHNGQEYDSKAIAGAAYFHATGQAPRPDEFHGGETGAAKTLERLGFDVVVDEEALDALRRKPVRSAATKPPREPREPREPKPPKPAKAAKPVKKAPPKRSAADVVAAAMPKVCPTCHMALPASGVCDFCD
ncbi:hypothetical protein [Nocardioides pakistanensis]